MRNRRMLIALVSVLFITSVAQAEDVEKIRKKLQKMDRELTTDSFHDAVDESEVKAVELFLQAGIDVNARDSSGETALHMAAEDDHASLIGMLLKAGADVNAKDNEGETPLYEAVDNGYNGVKATAPLIAAGADLKVRYEYGNTILHEAVSSDAPVPLKALLAAGTEIEAKNENGETPLYVAASLGRSVTPILIQAGANPNAPTKEGQTALMAAAEVGELESVRLLLEAKADVKLVDEQGNTALINAAGMLPSRMESFKVTEDQVTRMVELLLAAGSDVKARTKYEGVTPILAAAKEGHAASVALLLAAKADPNVRTDVDKTTPLIEAAKGGYGDVVKKLLEGGADEKAKDRIGKSAVVWASDYPAVASMLGATPAPGKAKPVVSAEQKERARLKLEELGFREYTEDMFVMSAHTGNLDAAQAFLDYGLRVDSKDSRDHATTPLLAASTLDDPSLALFLIKAGADVNAQDTNGATAIISAAQRCGMTSLVKALLDAGADVNAKAAGGATALMMAEVMKCADTLKLLKKAGAKK